jgi:hypothetical protein
MKLRDVLQELGFSEEWGAMTDEQPAYWYDFGNIKLTAAQVTNLSFKRVFLFSGGVCEPRTLGSISFQIPIEVDSFEQGVAWIADGLVKEGLGKEFRIKNAAPWIEQGRAWRDMLPWRLNKRKSEAKPHCFVDREWFRVAAKKLREQAGSANATDQVCFEFDGNVLRIKTSGAFLAMPAQGTAWDKAYCLPMSKLELLPKRMKRSVVVVNVWDDGLHIDS